MPIRVGLLIALLAVGYVMYCLETRPVEAQTLADPYVIEVSASGTRIRVYPWTDPETKCQYLVTAYPDYRSGVSMIRRGGFSDNGCADPRPH